MAFFECVTNNGTLFEYICIFNDDTTKSIISILDSKTQVLIKNRTTTGSFTWTADDGLKIVVTHSDQKARITPPSGKALQYINFNNGSVGTLTKLAVNATLTTNAPVFGNVVLLGYA